MTISVQDLLFQEETDSGRKWEKVDTKKKNIKIMFTSSTHVPSPPVNSYSHFCGAGMTICHFRGVLARSCDLGKLKQSTCRLCDSDDSYRSCCLCRNSARISIYLFLIDNYYF